VIAPVLRAGSGGRLALIVQISQNEFGWYEVQRGGVRRRSSCARSAQQAIAAPVTLPWITRGTSP